MIVYDIINEKFKRGKPMSLTDYCNFTKRIDNFYLSNLHEADVGEEPDESSPKIKNDCTSKFHRNVTCRAAYGLAVIGYTTVSSIDNVLGAIAAVGSLLTLGCSKSINKKAMSLTGAGSGIVSNTVMTFLCVINPNIVYEQNDTITSTFREKAIELARELRESNNCLKKYGASRAVYFGFAIASIVTQIIDFIIGIFAALGALFTLGHFKKLNSRAYSSLQLTLLHNVYYGLVKTINPWAAAPS